MSNAAHAIAIQPEASPAPEQPRAGTRGIRLGALIETFRVNGYGISVGMACAFGRQLCRTLERVHAVGGARRGGLRRHSVSLDSVFVTAEGEVRWIGLSRVEPGPADDASDVRNAALLVTDLLGGQATALQIVTPLLRGVLETAIHGPCGDESAIGAADLGMALGAEAASPSEVRDELRLVLPEHVFATVAQRSDASHTRLPAPPRVPTHVHGRRRVALVGARKPERAPEASGIATRRPTPPLQSGWTRMLSPSARPRHRALLRALLLASCALIALVPW